MIHQTKTALDGSTLHRIADDDGKRGTLWHRDADRAWKHWTRLAPLKGWDRPSRIFVCLPLDNG